MNITRNGITVTIADDEVIRMALDRLSATELKSGDEVRFLQPIPPHIGSVWEGRGGIYAGIVRGRDGGSDYHLIVGPENESDLGWDAANDWAKGLKHEGFSDYDIGYRSDHSVAMGMSAPRRRTTVGNWAAWPSRSGFLLVARHAEKVPPFLYEPIKRPHRAVGQVLDQLPMPGDIELAGPMHRMPALHWKTWVRLAFVEAGSDWRSLAKLQVHDGYLKDFAIESMPFRDGYGVRSWDETSGTITGDARPSKGAFSVADPRVEGHGKSVQLGVRSWDDVAPTVTGDMWPGQGPNSVADPRPQHWAGGKYRVTGMDQSAGTVIGASTTGQGAFAVADPRPTRERPFRNVFRIVRWNEASRAVTGGGHPTSGGIAVSDPRVGYGPNSHRNKLAVTAWEGSSKTVTGATQVQGGGLSVADPRRNHFSNYGVIDWDVPSRTIAGESFPSNGAFAVADPRSNLSRQKGDAFLTSGHYGIVPWTQTAGTVTGTLRHDNGPGNVADPRKPGYSLASDTEKPGSSLGLPGQNEKLVAVIRSLDDCWHRPFTTFELAALQGLIDPGERFDLHGNSDSAWRERIGNAIPPPAAEAIFGVIGTTLLLAWSGETFVLGSTPIWVRDVAVALSVATV